MSLSLRMGHSIIKSNKIFEMFQNYNGGMPKKRGVSNGFPPTLQKHEHEANWECEIGHEIVGFLQVKMLVSVVVCLSM